MVTLKTWKITYWNKGNKRVAKIQAPSKYAAKNRFYLAYPFDDIISIEEVTE